jgi:RND family efflux transporter MFP subunit
MKNFFKSKWIWAIGALGLMLMLGLIRNGQTTAAQGAPGSGETTVVFTGDLAESVTASGEVTAAQQARLSFETSGIVENVAVAVGDRVQAGDILIALDAEGLQRAVASAESSLRVAEAELSDLLSAPTESERLAAEAAVTSAQATLDALIAGPTAEEIAASQARLDAALANIWSASGSLDANYETSDADILQAEVNLQNALDNLADAEATWVRLADCSDDENGNTVCVPTDSDRMEAATENVESARAEVVLAEAQLAEVQNPDTDTIAFSQAGVAAAQANYDAAVARHEALLAGATPEEIAAAEADLLSAQADRDSLLAGPLETEINSYEIRVMQAQTDLTEAQNRLADAALLAPFDGLITAVHLTEGEMGAGIAVEMIATESLEVTLNVDEVDLALISVDQVATVSFETWPEREVAAEVITISPSSGANSGVVSFDVTLSLAKTDLPVLVGMTANADLITSSTTDSLLVANAAINADRDSGQYFVNKVAVDGSIEQVEVTLGLRNNELAQITNGLAEGDVVLLSELETPDVDVMSFMR